MLELSAQFSYQMCSIVIWKFPMLWENVEDSFWTFMSFLTSFMDIDEFSTESAHKAVSHIWDTRSYLPLTISVNKPVDWPIAVEPCDNGQEVFIVFTDCSILTMATRPESTTARSRLISQSEKLTRCLLIVWESVKKDFIHLLIV